MRAITIIIFIVLTHSFLAQTKPLEIYFDCYKLGVDTIPKSKILMLQKISVNTNDQYQILQSEMNYTSSLTKKLTQIVWKGNRIWSIFQHALNTATLYSKIYLDLRIKHPDGKVSANTIVFIIGNSKKSCDYTSNNKTANYKGKLTSGLTKVIPLANQALMLKDDNDKILQSTTTDKYGDFEFKNISTNNNYNIEVLNVEGKLLDNKLYITKQDGSQKKEMTKIGDSFVYKLLAIELTKLSEVEEDSEITLNTFNNSKNSQLTLLKDIQYEINSAEINEDARKILDNIIISLKENSSLKLNIISHTDSKGDDNSNKLLSEKRAKNVMNYLISHGINKEKLSAKGMGETNVLNRCTNDIDCSEAEHKLNRRTEFIFTK